MPDKMYAPSTLAQAVGVSPSTINRAIRDRILPAVNASRGRSRPTYRVRYRDALTFLLDRGLEQEEAEAALAK